MHDNATEIICLKFKYITIKNGIIFKNKLILLNINYKLVFINKI